MANHSHRFVEEYDGLVGYGLDRETNENTLIYYLQKFSDDQFMETIKGRMSDSDMEALFDMLTRLLKQYLKNEEYHRCFLKDGEE
ncbi:MAG: cytoplasmic protein [Deltaproteobacteria bacterium]|nr:cytoplasmic protein [Deltaproteobacteria bacterium]